MSLLKPSTAPQLPSELAPATAALPFITWRRTGINREQTLSAPMGVPRVSMAVTGDR